MDEGPFSRGVRGGGWARAAAMLKARLAGGGATGRGAAPLRAQLLHRAVRVCWSLLAPPNELDVRPVGHPSVRDTPAGSGGFVGVEQSAGYGVAV